MVTTMCRLQLFLELLLLAAELIAAAPIERKGGSEVEKTLEDFLSAYYDEFVEKRTEESDIYDTMQGDQPSNNINASEPEEMRNLSDLEHRKQSRENNENSLNGRSKENWIQVIKENLLRQLGRDNTTAFHRPNDGSLSSLNVSQILPSFLNTTNIIPDDQITEKIRSFYPSCEVPENMDANVWKDEQVMNLFFNFDYAAESRNTNVATATLRLYRLPENSTKSNSKSPDCSNNSTEDDRLLRVSIYWYTKPATKKRRAKKRLSDSKVITESSRWVELSAKPALRSWQRGRNLGLAVVVEDQEGDLLDAHRYFKGATCTVGASTPRPIPTIIRDAAEQTNKLGSLLGIPGRNSTATLHTDVRLLPTIDVCTLEFPDNYTPPDHIAGLRINACNLRKMHDHQQMLAEKERLERLATLPEELLLGQPPEGTSGHHIRHQRQHLEEANIREFDPRSRIVGSTVILRREELQSLAHNRSSYSTVNR